MVVKTITFFKKTWTLCSSSFIAAEKQGFFIQVHLASISMKQLTLINSGKEQGYSIRKVASVEIVKN
jgi:hypothetical protein